MSMRQTPCENAGIGRLTKQYNPGGAKNVGEWVQAVGAITPHQYSYRNQDIRSDMPVSEAVSIIRATSQAKRAQFAAQLGKHKRSRAGTPRTWQQKPTSDSTGSPTGEEEIIGEEVHYHKAWRRWEYSLRV